MVSASFRFKPRAGRRYHDRAHSPVPSAARHRCRQRPQWTCILRCGVADSLRVATPATCRMPKGLHAVGLITGQNSLQAIEAALAQLSQFLSASAAIAVLIDSRESGFCLKIRARLEQMGFRIEAGVRCQQGLVLSAYRHGFGQMEKAA